MKKWASVIVSAILSSPRRRGSIAAVAPSARQGWIPAFARSTKQSTGETMAKAQKCLFILLLAGWQALSFATLVTDLDPPHAHAGETLRLTFRLSQSQTSAQPDLSPLEHDFTVIGTTQQLSYTVINGVAQSLRQWTILLVAKKQGLLTIPSIQIGHERSAPRQVNITGPTKNSTSQTQMTPEEDVSAKLETQLSQPSAYINEQVIYTVKLYSDQPLLNGEYHAPRIENGLLIPLGNGQRTQTTLNGHDYAVDEQQYAIFPQKSGPLRIIPPVFSGLVYDSMPRQILLKGTEKSLMVKPIPKSHTGTHWLPAKKVALSEAYDTTDSTVPAGKTVVRTITLHAVGMPAELLPTIALSHNQAFNVYPEKPTTKNALNQNNLMGTQTTKVTYLFHQTGRVTLPSIDVAWFNTQTRRTEHATLPSHSFEITPKAGTPAAVSKPLDQTQAKPVSARPPTPPRSIWIISSAAMGLVCACIAMACAWAWRRQRAKPAPRHQPLRKSSVLGHPKEAKEAVLAWAAQQWPEATILNLNDVVMHAQDAPLKQAIDALSNTLYGPSHQQTPWNGRALWRSLAHYRSKKPTKKRTKPPLPPLSQAE